MTLMMHEANKSILLCADDFAQNEAISSGILLAAEAARINAVSCMVNTPYWQALHHGVRAVQDKIHVGLHLNLTHGTPVSLFWKQQVGSSFNGLPWLLQRSYLGRLSLAVVRAEIQAQWDGFVEKMNVLPDFIDGHQHIHQLPVIREALLGLVPSTIGVRATSPLLRDNLSFDGFPKRQLLSILGGATFSRCLKQQARSFNSHFSGMYDFKHAKDYRCYFQRFLSSTREGGLIMCHPGNGATDTTDPLYRSRHHELAYFLSDDFLYDLKQASCQLMRKT